MSKRIGVIGIVIDDPQSNATRVNIVISQYAQLIIGRMGIPNPEANTGMLALIIEGSTDDVGAFTGKLGNLPGITIKSALTSKKISKEELP